MMVIDWQEVRAQSFAEEAPPPEWPPHLRPLSWKGAALFGMDPRKPDELYWDGKRLVTAVRLGRFERWVAIIVTGSTLSLALTDGVRFVRDVGKFMGWWA